MGDGQDGQARHGHPAFPGRRVVPFPIPWNWSGIAACPSRLVVVGHEHRLADPSRWRRCWRRWRKCRPRRLPPSLGNLGVVFVWHQHATRHHGHVCRVVRHLAGTKSITIGFCRGCYVFDRSWAWAEVTIRGAAATVGIYDCGNPFFVGLLLLTWSYSVIHSSFQPFDPFFVTGGILWSNLRLLVRGADFLGFSDH